MKSYNYSRNIKRYIESRQPTKEELQRTSPLNPNFCYGISCNDYIGCNVSFNSNTTAIGDFERCYVERSDGYMHFAYNMTYMDDEIYDYFIDDGGFGTISVLFSAEDCEIVDVQDGYNSHQNINYSLCGREINLDDYDISDDGDGNTLYTKKEGEHDFPVIRGRFSVIYGKAQPESHFGSQVITTFQENYMVVDSANTLKCTALYTWTSVNTDYRLFVNPMIVDGLGYIDNNGDHFRLNFIAPDKEVLLPKGRVFAWSV